MPQTFVVMKNLTLAASAPHALGKFGRPNPKSFKGYTSTITTLFSFVRRIERTLRIWHEVRSHGSRGTGRKHPSLLC